VEKENGIKLREKWSSRVGFIWVASGAAVGLGNIWKFPYMAGNFGGSAFVLMYLVFVLLIAIPVMIAEIMLGKLSQRNAVDGFAYLARLNGRNPLWRFTGYLGTFTLQIVFCFYSVVAGWSIAYLYFGASNFFYQKSPDEIQKIWVQLLSQPIILVISSLLFIFFTMAIVYFGIKKGIEKACTFMMPGLLVVLLILVFYSISSSGLSNAMSFLFSFNPQKISLDIVIASLGHAFFTLAVGACAMMVYGSYLPKHASVVKTVFVVAFLDVIVALLAGLAIFPLIFEYGLPPGQGPGLMFVSLPMAFAKVPWGWFFSTLFFILLFFAALSSSLSFAEPLVDLLMEKKRISRQRAVAIIFTITFLGSMFCCFSFNIFADIKIFGRWTFFELLADLSTNLLLPLGGIAISIFAGLVVKKENFLPQNKYGKTVFMIWRFIALLVAPIAILIVMMGGFFSLFL
jgi:neurotransmitter:Na+ symporter, NSS family